LDITATDESGNSASFENVSSYFVGSTTCGNGICDQEENYCICPGDCSPPSCSSNEQVSCESGLPACVALTEAPTQQAAETQTNVKRPEQTWIKYLIWAAIALVITAVAAFFIIPPKEFRYSYR
jgi:hypothetical protein